MDTFLLPDGYFGPYDQNEVRLVATRDDPVKYRGGVRQDVLEGTNLCGLSGNITRMDGRDEEYGLVMIRLAPNRQDGAIELCTRKAGEAQPDGRAYIDAYGAHFHVPVYAPNLGGGGGMPTRIALRSLANGRLVCAEAAGTQPLQANRDAVGPWETFEVIPVA